MNPKKFRAYSDFILLLILVFILGALSSSTLFYLFGPVLHIPLHKLTGHLTLLLGIIFCIIYLKWNDIGIVEGFGFNIAKKEFLRDSLKGFFVGLFILLILVIAYLSTGIFEIEPQLNVSIPWLIKIIAGSFIAGCIVAIIEETIFRGALFSGLQKQANASVAIILTSVTYAAVHYVKYSTQIPATEFNWYSGLIILSGAFDRFSDPAIIDSILTLTALGVLLSLTRCYTGNIAMATGIHAGIVMAIKISGELTDFVHGNHLAFLVNQHDHMLGLLAFIWLFIICILYYVKRPGTKI